jgi:hypothetical protein
MSIRKMLRIPEHTFYSFSETTGDLISMVEIQPGSVSTIYGPTERPKGLLHLARLRAPIVTHAPTLVLARHRGKVVGEARGSFLGTPLSFKGAMGKVMEKRLWERGMKGSRQLHCVVEPVLEPLKCRLVTKADSLPYWLAKGWQKALWSHVAKRKPTALVGRPISGSDIVELARISSNMINHGGDVYWQSVDYSSATDRMNLHFTMLSHEASIDAAIARGSTCLDLRTRAVLRSVLGPHIIHYDLQDQGDLDEGDRSLLGVSGIDPVRQMNGQLMGSPLSFPHLCAVNFCAFWAAYEDYMGRRVDRESVPCLVNGDDELFLSSMKFYREFWVPYRDMVGFEPSVGKNYSHPTIAVMNSVLFFAPLGLMASGGKEITLSGLRDWRGARISWADQVVWDDKSSPSNPIFAGDEIRGVPYWTCKAEVLTFPNWGLLIGQTKVSRVAKGRFVADSGTLACSYREVVPPSRNRARMHSRWMHYHINEVQSSTQAGLWNLFFQPEFGGIGLIAYPGMEVIATPFQLHVAQLLKSRISGPHSERPKIIRYNLAPSDTQGFEVSRDRKGLTWIRRCVGPLFSGAMEDGKPLVFRPFLPRLLGTGFYSFVKASDSEGPRRVSRGLILEVRRLGQDLRARMPSVGRFQDEVHGVIAYSGPVTVSGLASSIAEHMPLYR